MGQRAVYPGVRERMQRCSPLPREGGPDLVLIAQPVPGEHLPEPAAAALLPGQADAQRARTQMAAPDERLAQGLTIARLDETDQELVSLTVTPTSSPATACSFTSAAW